MSFFDDGEETAPRPSTRTLRPRPPAGGGPRRPRPRRPLGAGGAGADQHTLMVRRLVAAGVAVVLLIVIALVVNGCVKSEKQSSLKSYNRNVSQLAQESDEQVSHPLFVALSGASGKSALDVEQQVDELSLDQRKLAERVQSLSVPGEMTGAQRNLLLAFNLRAEGMSKLAALLPKALGGQAKAASTLIAGDMEIFLASDVIYSQRVAPLIQEVLASNSITGLTTTATRFLPNIGWLEASTVQMRITGQAASTSASGVAPGHHGSVLKGVSVGTTTLEAEPALNHIAGGGSPAFTVMVENDGEFSETNVKVDVTITAGGKTLKGSGVIPTTEPGKTAKAEITVTGVPLNLAAKIEVQVEPVPGETNHEGTKGTFLAIFGE